MADTKISALTAISVIAGEDLFAAVDDPSGTPATTKATITQLATFLAANSTVYTNSHRFTGATMRIPLSATPTMSVDGDFAIDTTITDFSMGLIKYYDGEEMAVVAMPIAQLTSPTDGTVVSYNASNDEFELVASGGGANQFLIGNYARNARNLALRFDPPYTDLNEVTPVANAERTMPLAFAFTLMLARMQVNALSAATPVKVLKNGVNGNNSVSITAGSTGDFQDTSNSDSFAVGDTMTFGWDLSGSTGSATTIGVFGVGTI